ncbi:LysR family transcriptional regulator [Nocardia sp. NPDC020380]|uniref:LysR family transcriptional regulator n=1 Tax=Nocardia sp. NPDC020380 TaxID=3364309 RepID=UPI0037BC63CD
MTSVSAPSADLDLRLVRCFLAVAEHRNFGRAADSVFLTQSSLSRQIARLERDLGVRLLDRTPQRVQLTEAGAVFLPLAEELLRGADRAVARVRSAGAPGRLTIGFTTGLIITPAVRALRQRFPEVEVRTQHLDSCEPRAALLEHRVDAVVSRTPFPADQLRVTALYDEPRVVVVAADHRLAGKESVTLADIVDEPLVRVRQADPDWCAFWRLEPRPDGRPAPGGPIVENIEDRFEAVAAGDAITIAAAPTTLRPDLITILLEGVEPSHVVLATRAEDRNPLLPAFREYAGARLHSAAQVRATAQSGS